MCLAAMTASSERSNLRARVKRSRSTGWRRVLPICWGVLLLVVDWVLEGILGWNTERAVEGDGVTGVDRVFSLGEMLGGGVL